MLGSLDVPDERFANRSSLRLEAMGLNEGRKASRGHETVGFRLDILTFWSIFLAFRLNIAWFRPRRP